MLFIGLAKFKTKLSKEVVAQNLKDIESDTKGQVRYLGIWWTLGKYDTVVMFEAPDEKEAMNMVMKRVDRMKRETLVAVPAKVNVTPSGVWTGALPLPAGAAEAAGETGAAAGLAPPPTTSTEFLPLWPSSSNSLAPGSSFQTFPPSRTNLYM